MASSSNLKLGFLTVTCIAAVAVILWQQKEIKRLTAECSALRAEINEASARNVERDNLAEQAKATNNSAASQLELMRLRGQSARLRQVEQANEKLKLEAERFAAQMAQTRTPVQPPDQKPVPPGNFPFPQATEIGVVELSENTPV